MPNQSEALQSHSSSVLFETLTPFLIDEGQLTHLIKIENRRLKELLLSEKEREKSQRRIADAKAKLKSIGIDPNTQTSATVLTPEQKDAKTLASILTLEEKKEAIKAIHDRQISQARSIKLLSKIVAPSQSVSQQTSSMLSNNALIGLFASAALLEENDTSTLSEIPLVGAFISFYVLTLRLVKLLIDRRLLVEGEYIETAILEEFSNSAVACSLCAKFEEPLTSNPLVPFHNPILYAGTTLQDYKSRRSWDTFSLLINTLNWNLSVIKTANHYLSFASTTATSATLFSLTLLSVSGVCSLVTSMISLVIQIKFLQDTRRSREQERDRLLKENFKNLQDKIESAKAKNDKINNGLKNLCEKESDKEELERLISAKAKANEIHKWLKNVCKNAIDKEKEKLEELIKDKIENDKINKWLISLQQAKSDSEKLKALIALSKTEEFQGILRNLFTTDQEVWFQSIGIGLTAATSTITLGFLIANLLATTGIFTAPLWLPYLPAVLVAVAFLIGLYVPLRKLYRAGRKWNLSKANALDGKETLNTLINSQIPTELSQKNLNSVRPIYEFLKNSDEFYKNLAPREAKERALQIVYWTATSSLVLTAFTIGVGLLPLLIPSTPIWAFAIPAFFTAVAIALTVKAIVNYINRRTEPQSTMTKEKFFMVLDHTPTSEKGEHNPQKDIPKPQAQIKAKQDQDGIEMADNDPLDDNAPLLQKDSYEKASAVKTANTENVEKIWTCTLPKYQQLFTTNTSTSAVSKKLKNTSPQLVTTAYTDKFGKAGDKKPQRPEPSPDCSPGYDPCNALADIGAAMALGSFAAIPIRSAM